MPAHGLPDGFRRAVSAAALCGTLGLTGLAAHAEPIDVMTIGNSVTWGFQWDPASSGDPGALDGTDTFTTFGGWRVPLAGNLASDPRFVNSFNYVGVKGDSNTLTVPEETGRITGPPAGDDSGDGAGNNTDFLHEGYSGWYIDETASNLSFADGRQGIFENLASQGGAIDPANADVVMLSIGINDLIRRADADTGYTPDSDVVRLNALIAQIKTDSPDAIVLVSNLLPFNDGETPFNLDANNADVDGFNTELLNTFFGGAFDSDGLAVHSGGLSDVFLLDVNTLFTDAYGGDPSTDFLNTFNDDNLHPTQAGYNNLADIYTDAFANLSIGIPEPSSGLLVALGAGLAAARRRRA